MGQNAMEDQVVGWILDKNCFPLLFEDLPGQTDQFGVTTQMANGIEQPRVDVFDQLIACDSCLLEQRYQFSRMLGRTIASHLTDLLTELIPELIPTFVHLVQNRESLHEAYLGQHEFIR